MTTIPKASQLGVAEKNYIFSKQMKKKKSENGVVRYEARVLW